MPLPGISPNARTSVYREVSQSFTDLVSEHSTSHERVSFRSDAERNFFKRWMDNDAEESILGPRPDAFGVIHEIDENYVYCIKDVVLRDQMAGAVADLFRQVNHRGDGRKLCVASLHKIVLLEQEWHGVSLRYDPRSGRGDGDIMRAHYPCVNEHVLEALIRLCEGSATRAVGVR